MGLAGQIAAGDSELSPATFSSPILLSAPFVVGSTSQLEVSSAPKLRTQE